MVFMGFPAMEVQPPAQAYIHPMGLPWIFGIFGEFSG
jgi:hypothetical protein